MRRVHPTSLLGSWRAHGRLRVELWESPCIVMTPPSLGLDDDACDALVNPANERLQGTLFTPSECSSKLRNNIIYPPQAVDGIVSELGGAELAAACMALPEVAPGGTRCATGEAVLTPAFGELLMSYNKLVHTCAPLYCGDSEWRRATTACYHSAFDVAQDAGLAVVASPLLGAGARGAPIRAASNAAAAAVSSWHPHGDSTMSTGRAGLRVVRFAVQESSIAETLSEAFEMVLKPIGEDGM